MTGAKKNFCFEKNTIFCVCICSCDCTVYTVQPALFRARMNCIDFILLYGDPVQIAECEQNLSKWFIFIVQHWLMLLCILFNKNCFGRSSICPYHWCVVRTLIISSKSQNKMNKIENFHFSHPKLVQCEEFHFTFSCENRGACVCARVFWCMHKIFCLLEHAHHVWCMDEVHIRRFRAIMQTRDYSHLAICLCTTRSHIHFFGFCERNFLPFEWIHIMFSFFVTFTAANCCLS